MGRGGRRGQKWKLLASMLMLKVSMGASSESMVGNAGEHQGCMVAMAVVRFGGQNLKRLTSSVKLLHASHGLSWFCSVCNRSSHD